MPRSLGLAVVLALQGCLLVPADALDDRLDLDGDGLDFTADCDDNDATVGAPGSWFGDDDGDGYGTDDPIVACTLPDGAAAMDGDCDDTDGSVHPGAAELCNLLDDDCSGAADEGAGSTWHLDGDDDGYGDADGTPVIACDRPGAAYTTSSGDCDDTDPLVYPRAPVACTSDDRNCDGVVDDVDGDGDGFAGCEECDDAAKGTYPDADEICDGVDEDCDGAVDDDAIDATTYFADLDADGFGDDTTTVLDCAGTPAGFADKGGDCDDTRDDVSPAADERCNGIDDDCDGTENEAPIDGSVWFLDSDADGFGADATATDACAAPGTDYVSLGADCNDTDSTKHPGAVEDCAVAIDLNCDGSSGTDDLDNDGWVACGECDDRDAKISPEAQESCNGIDDDCDGNFDEIGAVDAPTWYADADGDGYGDSTATIDACSAPAGYVADGTDCDDASSGRNPSAVELCDGTDDDCDGAVDDNPAAPPTWYRDADSDDAGDPLDTKAACTAPVGYVATDDDCDDADDTRSPAATESCNGLDDDCDRLVDEDVTAGAPAWHPDVDLDGAGDASTTVLACVAPPGLIADGSDCDDADKAINPSATEVCDSADVDEDCDGDADKRVTWYADMDNDGLYGTTTTIDACVQPAGYSPTASDCNDNDATIGAAGAEVCDPADADEDCDGLADDQDPTATGKSTWYADADQDGAGGTTSASACDAPPDHVATSTDCDDTRNDVSPTSPEVCDAANVDEDCDTKADDADSSASGKTTYFADVDGDTYGGPATVSACDAAAGRVTTSTDCDDGKALVNPGGTEVCNGVDDDCDKQTDEGVTTAYYRDSDLDLFGDPLVTLSGCSAPAGYVTDKTDCDDATSLVSPAGSELCNGVDDDCDTLVDDGVKTTYYRDVDGDAHGVASPTALACAAPAGFAAAPDDCNDGAAAVHPGATELCNKLDDDCDTQVDEGACSSICPVYAKAGLSTNGDGSATLPYKSITDAIALRGSCLQINVLPGTYAEQVDYNGLALELVSTGGAAVTTIDPPSGAGVVFDAKETAAAVLQGFTITGGTGQLGDGVDLLSSTRYGGGIYVRRAAPTILDNVITANTGAQRGGGVALCGFGGVFSGNTVTNNQTTSGDGGGLYTACSSTGSVDGNVISTNRTNGGGSVGGGIYALGGSMAFTHNLLDGNVSTANGVSGDGIYLRQSASVVTNNVILDHAGEAVSFASKDQSVFLNNTLDGNAIAIEVQDNGQITSRVVNNLMTNGTTGVSASDKSITALAAFADNDVFGNTTAYTGTSQTGKNGNVSVNPLYVDSVAEDFHLQVTSPVANDGQSTAIYGVLDDFDGVARPLGAAYSMGAYER